MRALLKLSPPRELPHVGVRKSLIQAGLLPFGSSSQQNASLCVADWSRPRSESHNPQVVHSCSLRQRCRRGIKVSYCESVSLLGGRLRNLSCRVCNLSCRVFRSSGPSHNEWRWPMCRQISLAGIAAVAVSRLLDQQTYRRRRKLSALTALLR